MRSLGLNYLAQIDNEGKLRWARTGELVDTTPGRWKDARRGRGIIPIPEDSDANADRTNTGILTPGSQLSGESDPNTTLHYYLPAEPSPTSSRIKRWLWRNFTPRGLLERLLRATIQKDTWIYVSVSIVRLHDGSSLMQGHCDPGQALFVFRLFFCYDNR